MANNKKRPVNDELELDQAYAELTGYDIHKKKKKSHPIAVFLLILAFGLGGCALGLPFLLGEPVPTEPPAPSTEVTVPTTQATVPTTEPEATSGNLQAWGMDLSGMTASELEAALMPVRDAFEDSDMVVSIDGQDYALTPSDTGAGLDLDAAVRAILEAADGEFDLWPYVTLDTEYLRGVVDGWREAYNTEYCETTCAVSGEMPALTSGGGKCQTLMITKGSPDRALDCDMLYEAMLQAYYDRTFYVGVESEFGELEAFDLGAIYDYYYIAPRDAAMSSSTFAITAEQWGYDFDLSAAQAALEAAAYGETVEVSFRLRAPSVTAEALSAVLFRDVLATYSSPYTDDENRTENLRLACAAINGVVLNPGESLSYNKALGERTEARGYKPAASFLNGQVVKTVGGGICQVSSNLYYCALMADLDIVVRSNHSMTVDYVPLGMDAMVNWGTQDFKIRNNTDYPIRIIASVAGGNVNVSIEGTDEKNYYVRMEYEINETYPYDTEYRQMYADNEDGFQDGDVLTEPSTGYKITTYKCKYNKQTGELISREYEATSKYRTRNAVIVHIIDESTDPEGTQ